MSLQYQDGTNIQNGDFFFITAINHRHEYPYFIENSN